MAYTYQRYQPSQRVRQAQEELQRHQTAQPAAYTSRWQTQLEGVLEKILQREPFSYDMNSDALYRRYRDAYTRQGKLAMQDTMGQAAALTGGYGSSYAQQAGQQAYQSSLSQLNDRLPELYQLALSRYQQQGSDLAQQWSLLRQGDSDDYSRYRDTVSDWQTNRDYLASRFDTAAQQDYDRYDDDRALDYSVWKDSASRAGSQVSALLAAGIRPSSALLAQADVSAEYADGLLQAQSAAAASQSTGRKAAQTLEQQYARLKERGATQRELDKLLRNAIGTRVAGQYISAATATAIRDRRR